MSRVLVRVITKQGPRTIAYSCPDDMAHVYLSGFDYDQAAVIPEGDQQIGRVAQIIAFRADMEKPRGD